MASLPNKLSHNRIVSDFSRLALTNQYELHIPSIALINNKTDFATHLKLPNYNLTSDWISRNIGILCSEATLPTSAFATAEVKDNFMGVPQEFAHTRFYSDMDFTFYVDSDYKIIRFFDGWMDFISGASEISQTGVATQDPEKKDRSKGYYRRMQWPDSYKLPKITLYKFEKDLNAPRGLLGATNSTLRYEFINVFPKSTSATPLSYGGAEVLRFTVTMNFDRYIVQRSNVTVGAVNKDDQTLAYNTRNDGNIARSYNVFGGIGNLQNA